MGTGMSLKGKKNPRAEQNPLNITFIKNVGTNSFANEILDNNFIVFKSLHNIIYLIYYDSSKSITSYNLITFQIINKIRTSPDEDVSNLRHFQDRKNKRDLFISISKDNNSIKLWNVNILKCLLNIKNLYSMGYLYSACFLHEKNSDQNFIIISNYNKFNNCQPIKVLDFSGKIIGEINNSKSNVLYIDSFYDKKSGRDFIITGNRGCIKSYDFNQNKIYHKYSENDIYGHYSLVVNDMEKNIKLIESSMDGNIRIWNFHSGKLIKKIRVNDEGVYGVCLWDVNFLFVGCRENGVDKKIKIVDIKNGKIVKELVNHRDNVLCIKKIKIPKYGKCILSQGHGLDGIKLWGIKS